MTIDKWKKYKTKFHHLISEEQELLHNPIAHESRRHHHSRIVVIITSPPRQLSVRNTNPKKCSTRCWSAPCKCRRHGTHAKPLTRSLAAMPIAAAARKKKNEPCWRRVVVSSRRKKSKNQISIEIGTWIDYCERSDGSIVLFMRSRGAHKRVESELVCVTRGLCWIWGV